MYFYIFNFGFLKVSANHLCDSTTPHTIIIITPSQCECKDPNHKAMACGKPGYKGDGFCDDENNNAACAYDEGDCCGDSVKKSGNA